MGNTIKELLPLLFVIVSILLIVRVANHEWRNKK